MEEELDLKVTFYHRRPQCANFSIERLFSDVRRSLTEGIVANVAVSHFSSTGFFKRLYNVVEAAFRQGDINHITGDVHYLTFLLNRKRTLLTIHDLVSVHRLKGYRRAIFLYLWYSLPIKRVEVVSVISESSKRELLRHVAVNPHKIRVIHNPVSADFRPVLKCFNDDKPVILQIGTRPNKNIERVLLALVGINCHLRVIGRLSEAQQSTIRQYSIDYSSVADVSDSQIIAEYAHCDLLVFASTYEGFGLPIVEAQAVGRAVITSNILSMPEVAGGGACLVDPFDVASIRAGVIKVITNTSYREILILKGLSNIERFKVKHIAQQYEDIYNELSSRRNQ